MNDNSDHYFYDSNGDMWVNISAMKDSIDIIPLGGGEIRLKIDQVLVDKQNPVLAMSLTTEAHEKLSEVTFNEYDWTMEDEE